LGYIVDIVKEQVNNAVDFVSDNQLIQSLTGRAKPRDKTPAELKDEPVVRRYSLGRESALMRTIHSSVRIAPSLRSTMRREAEKKSHNKKKKGTTTTVGFATQTIDIEAATLNYNSSLPDLKRQLPTPKPFRETMPSTTTDPTMAVMDETMVLS